MESEDNITTVTLSVPNSTISVTEYKCSCGNWWYSNSKNIGECKECLKRRQRKLRKYHFINSRKVAQ